MKSRHRRNGLINRGDGELRVESRFIRTALPRSNNNPPHNMHLI
jgi:hypothetical protein